MEIAVHHINEKGFIGNVSEADDQVVVLQQMTMMIGAMRHRDGFVWE